MFLFNHNIYFFFIELCWLHGLHADCGRYAGFRRFHWMAWGVRTMHVNACVYKTILTQSPWNNCNYFHFRSRVPPFSRQGTRVVCVRPEKCFSSRVFSQTETANYPLAPHCIVLLSCHYLTDMQSRPVLLVLGILATHTSRQCDAVLTSFLVAV